VQARKLGFLNRTLEGKPVRSSYPCRGRKCRKHSAVYRSLRHDHNQVAPNNFLGSYVATTFQIDPALLNAKREPISDHAKELLRDYFRREEFWEAVESRDVPLGFAGETFLYVKPRRAQQIHKELSDAGGPWCWFVRSAMNGIASGKIARGRATLPCQIADLFFSVLTDGAGGIGELLGRAFGGTAVAQVNGSYEGIDALGREVLEYMACRPLADPPDKKGDDHV
jgi:hypothetical protein